MTNGTSLSLNSASTLVLGCVASAKNDVTAGGAPAFVLSKASILATYTMTIAVTAVSGAALTVSGGTILYDSINGNRANYDHIIVSSSFAIAVGTAFPVNSNLVMYIPSLATTDAGTYYCSFIDGSATSQATATSYASSGSFVLTVTTKSGSGAKTVSGLRNRALEYSLLLLGASKVLL